MSTGPPAEGWLVRRAEVDGHVVDVRWRGEVVEAVGVGLDPAGCEVVDAAGGAMLPGLHDHHLHLLAMAARVASLDLDGLGDPAAVDAALARAAATSGGGWVRAGGYDEHRHGPLDRHRLDAVASGAALRVQHRTGLSWVLSSEAMARLGLLPPARRSPSWSAGAGVPPGSVEVGPTGQLTGRLHRADGWLGEQLALGAPPLAPVGARLAALGITGVTDATPELGPGALALLAEASEQGDLPQRIVLLGVDQRIGLGTWAEHGPTKLLADEHRGLDLDALATAIARHHDAGRAVAIHAVERAEVVTAVAALLAAGARPADRIEHGAVIPPELDAALAEAGVTVVVQPGLVAERGDHHLATVAADDVALLHRQASLIAAGVRLATGSDAPVTDVDPWAAIAAASDRRTRAGAVVGLSERVPPAVALRWYLTDPHDPGGACRRVAPGERADLCLLRAPLTEALRAPSAALVRRTWIRGRCVHR